eukprot:COSAG02_NODE_4786_length_4977_cov_6.788233_4_plen_44_part_00
MGDMDIAASGAFPFTKRCLNPTVAVAASHARRCHLVVTVDLSV